MANLRSNVVFSTLAMLLVGLLRPGFNAIVTRAFGPEVNGRAATVIALIFLASLPATAALPTVMVRQVSRSLGQGQVDEARGQASLAFGLAGLLTILGAGLAISYGLYRSQPALTGPELWVVVLGLVGYAYWRLGRILLLAIGQASTSLRADLASVVLMFATLGLAVALERPGLVVAAFVSIYLIYAAWTFRSVWGAARGGTLSPESKKEALTYNLLWFLGSAASLAAREISLLLLDARVERALVGEVSLCLSFLLMLALAPRIIEVPLVHELSSLGGEAAKERQHHLTEKSIHWLTVLSLAAGFGMAILAEPVLKLAGGVATPVVVQAFALVALTFMTEMMLTPANNLLVAEAPPAVMTQAGVYSLVAAVVWWWSPMGQGVLGVMAGLGLSFLVKAMVVAFEVRRRFQVRLFLAPGRKLLILAAGSGGLALTMTGLITPWIPAAVFGALVLIVFRPEAKEAWAALKSTRTSA